ncbi:hypothetical protein [Clostridium estertheticum]|uniref:Uncharacterized protein n=1 Tax=Clostridium estertheticum subsp. estertheticum TaxID=1552 RepID=A0A1J0GIW3_9CLOT|nr:hypothetical protein [Clostridium estertheticum]APC41265.1 hypothetical protein A7L45_14865 [Clostridium estertheticum subsp. estertheticum]MBU3172876.1 hypothetical protein [Clostridium estertheticum]MBZ9616903.1 hypothetical protein [Clostridium estertheticum subsp. laramiense]WAG72606.1 hypothetical protein LL032_15810 [Clostridium estertheticum]
MISMATINDIDSFVKLRIKLLKEVNNNIENYDWDKYLEVLKKFYYDSLQNRKNLENFIEFLDPME